MQNYMDKLQSQKEPFKYSNDTSWKSVILKELMEQIEDTFETHVTTSEGCVYTDKFRYKLKGPGSRHSFLVVLGSNVSAFITHGDITEKHEIVSGESLYTCAHMKNITIEGSGPKTILIRIYTEPPYYLRNKITKLYQLPEDVYIRIDYNTPTDDDIINEETISEITPRLASMMVPDNIRNSIFNMIMSEESDFMDDDFEE